MVLVDAGVDDPNFDSGSGIRCSAGDGAPRGRYILQVHSRVEVALDRRKILHVNYPRDLAQLAGGLTIRSDKDGVHQRLRGRDHFHLAARQFREHAALRATYPLKLGLRRGAVERGAGLDLPGHRCVFED